MMPSFANSLLRQIAAAQSGRPFVSPQLDRPVRDYETALDDMIAELEQLQPHPERDLRLKELRELRAIERRRKEAVDAA